MTRLSVSNEFRLAIDEHDVDDIVFGERTGLEGTRLTVRIADLEAIAREIVMKLNAEVAKHLENADTRNFYIERFLVPIGGTPETLGEWVRRDIARWREVIQKSGITPE